MRRFLRTYALGGSPQAINPANLAGLAWYINSTQKVWTDAGGTVPATNGSLVQRWDDLGPNGYNVTQAIAGSRPNLVTGATPAGHQAVQFGPSPANNQLSFVPGVSGTIPPGNGAGYTCYMWINPIAVDNAGKPGYIVLDITNGSGFRFDEQFVGSSVTALEYAPGSFGFTTSDTGWQMWTFVCNPPVNSGSPSFGTGDIQIYKNGVQVGPCPASQGVVGVTAWNMLLQNVFYVSANPVDNVPFFGYVGAMLLFSGNHGAGTRAGVEAFIRGTV